MMIIRFEQRHGFVSFQKKKRTRKEKEEWFLLFWGEERKEGARNIWRSVIVETLDDDPNVLVADRSGSLVIKG